MNIAVTNLKPQIAVAMKKTAVSMEQIADVTTQGYAKLMEHLAEQGKQIAGAPYLAYMNGNEDFSKFDIELGIPVSEPVPVQGEFYMSQTYDGKAITTTYKGAYKEIEVAYVALMDYAKENALEMTGVYYDYYISNPADTPESELLTQVVFPIK
ncbi:MAG: GyrI-like domain-containing protein [Dehalococcoidia bacterium]|nr:GyrI-like domain-containing protein [Dehalococcoidia bacterium]